MSSKYVNFCYIYSVKIPIFLFGTASWFVVESRCYVNHGRVDIACMVACNMGSAKVQEEDGRGKRKGRGGQS